MNILAIDTCTKKANVSLKNGNKIVDKSVDNEITHSEKLLPLVNEILNENNVNITDINYLATSIGPGSFTGIRIGIATVKAFAKILNKPVFTSSSLDMFAYSNINNLPDYVLSVMDAKNNRIYYCLYQVEKHILDNETIPVLKPLLDYSNDVIDVALVKISDLLSNDLSAINIVGDCVEKYKKLFINSFDSKSKEINILDGSLSTKDLIKMIDNYSKLGINKDFEKNYLTLDAIYVRPSQAERAKNNEL